MQIVCLETIYMKYQKLFSGKSKTKYFKMSSAECFTQHAKVDKIHFLFNQFISSYVYYNRAIEASGIISLTPAWGPRPLPRGYANTLQSDRKPCI